jgi:recombination protein RecA
MAKKKITTDDILDKYSEFLIPKEKKIEVIPTGSLSLDVSTGIGGIPIGRFTEVFGPESSGKTTLCLSIAKHAIDKGKKVLYVEPENSLTMDYIDSLLGNFDERKLDLYQPETAEQALAICEDGIQTGQYDLIVLDSIGALYSKLAKDKELGDKSVALISWLLTQFMGRNAYAVDEKKVAFVFVNQVRDSIGSYVHMLETPGGHALKHYLSLRIQLRKSEDITQGENKIGIYSLFTIKKNKLAAPYRTSLMPIIFGKGIDSTRNIIEFAEMLGVLEKRAGYYVYQGETVGHGGLKTKIALEENVELLDKIVQECYSRVNYVGKEKGDGEELEDQEIIRSASV